MVPIRDSLILACTIVVTGWLTYLATLSHAEPVAASHWLLASGLVLFAYLPALWISRLISNAAVKPLVVFGWRFSVLLPALAFTTRLSGDEINCFVAVLLACYLVALPLESWLLIREANRSENR